MYEEIPILNINVEELQCGIAWQLRQRSLGPGNFFMATDLGKTSNSSGERERAGGRKW